jgi:Ca2+-binding RTX toxin-like protein
VRGYSFDVVLTATDPDSADQTSTFTYHIDWNGDGVVDQTVVGASAVTVQHLFIDAGVYNVRATATDRDGGVSEVAQRLIQVVDWDLRPNADDGALLDLVWGGTIDADAVQFIGYGPYSVAFGPAWSPWTTSTTVTGVTGSVLVFGQAGDDLLLAFGSLDIHVEAGDGKDVAAILDGAANDYRMDGGAGNDFLIYLGGAGSQIFIQGSDGDDQLHVAGGVGVTGVLDAGDGDDFTAIEAGVPGLNLLGGGGNDVFLLFNGGDTVDGGAGGDLILAVAPTGGTLLGGDGDDLILGGVGTGGADLIDGGAGDDMLVGSLGGDTLIGGAGDDLILAGDLHPVLFGEDAAMGLMQIFYQWTAPQPFVDRVAYVTTTPGPIVQPAYYLSAKGTVLDDGSVDILLSGDDRDFLFYNVGQDAADFTMGSDLHVDLA